MPNPKSTILDQLESFRQEGGLEHGKPFLVSYPFSSDFPVKKTTPCCPTVMKKDVDFFTPIYRYGWNIYFDFFSHFPSPAPVPPPPRAHLVVTASEIPQAYDDHNQKLKKQWIDENEIERKQFLAPKAKWRNGAKNVEEIIPSVQNDFFVFKSMGVAQLIQSDRNRPDSILGSGFYDISDDLPKPVRHTSLGIYGKLHVKNIGLLNNLYGIGPELENISMQNLDQNRSYVVPWPTQMQPLSDLIEFTSSNNSVGIVGQTRDYWHAPVSWSVSTREIGHSDFYIDFSVKYRPDVPDDIEPLIINIPTELRNPSADIELVSLIIDPDSDGRCP